MWLRYFDGPSEIIEKVTSVCGFCTDDSYPYIWINKHYPIKCASAKSCKEFFGEIMSRLNDTNAIIWDDNIINFEDE